MEGTSKKEEKIIRTLTQSDDFPLLFEEETVIQGRIDRLVENGR
jgi:hypothetical protein